MRGNCTVGPIPQPSFDAESVDNSHIRMTTPKEFFNFDDNQYTYQGVVSKSHFVIIALPVRWRQPSRRRCCLPEEFCIWLYLRIITFYFYLKQTIIVVICQNPLFICFITVNISSEFTFLNLVILDKERINQYEAKHLLLLSTFCRSYVMTSWFSRHRMTKDTVMVHILDYNITLGYMKGEYNEKWLAS